MDEREIDRAIDTAARRMIGREPGRTLSHSVMARVREGVEPAPPRRFMWMTAAAGIVLCGAIAIGLMNRAASGVVPPPSAAQMPFGVPPAIPDAPAANDRHVVPARRAAAAMTTKVATSLQPPLDYVSPIEPIETEPIVFSAIEVPRLEHETTAIAAIDIEALTIAPLTTSND